MTGKFAKGHSRSAKLTPDQVLEIRRLYADERFSQGRLARQFQISVGQIGRIIRGESWGQYQNPAADQTGTVVLPTLLDIEESLEKVLEAVEPEVSTEPDPFIDPQSTDKYF